jgi:hypothetical protein
MLEEAPSFKFFCSVGYQMGKNFDYEYLRECETEFENIFSV